MMVPTNKKNKATTVLYTNEDMVNPPVPKYAYLKHSKMPTKGFRLYKNLYPSGMRDDG